MVDGSGTGTLVVAVRMLSSAKAGAATPLNVTLTLLNGIVLSMPANPPANVGVRVDAPTIDTVGVENTRYSSYLPIGPYRHIGVGVGGG